MPIELKSPHLQVEHSNHFQFGVYVEASFRYRYPLFVNFHLFIIRIQLCKVIAYFPKSLCITMWVSY